MADETDPRFPAAPTAFRTIGGIDIRRHLEDLPVKGAIEPVIDALDGHKGVLLASSYEYPGRYTRWDIGFVDPPLEVTARAREFRVQALNARGEALIPAVAEALEAAGLALATRARAALAGAIPSGSSTFVEEDRSKQPSVFTLLRALVELFRSDADAHLGLYGAFGYDLALQFEPLRPRLERSPRQRDLVLYLPDEILIVDHQRERATRISYEFGGPGWSTAGLPGGGVAGAFLPGVGTEQRSDHAPGEYAAGVRVAREAFRRGDLFEAVLSQTFEEPCHPAPSELFRRLRERNPAPYGFLINLGDREYLVGASPEMYVRVDGDRVETCPLSGTIARGDDPIADAARIQELLNSQKDQAELTMCTDVDRNDKSRICVPGSVRVIGRRQIEMYSRLIHTADHVEGHLRAGFDALDAFLAHTWAVTVTGAPKAWAMQFLEDHERSARAWYGGAVGVIGFNGNLNTGLTLRTVHITDGTARVRVGATLLYDSDPDAEERETHVKASALLDAIRRPAWASEKVPAKVPAPGSGRRVLLVDHQDSFVHTLANYLRQTGAEVTTLRAGFPLTELDRLAPDLVVLSPGPGRPADFRVAETVGACVARSLPVFGVCLGLQGIVEHFGGSLSLLAEPVHGKPSHVHASGGRLFNGLPQAFVAGRYHSLYANEAALPACLCVTARSDDGIIMAIEHRELPIAAVQFHPESILTLDGQIGLHIMSNVVGSLPGATPGGKRK